MFTVYELRNCSLLKKGGSLIFCKGCERIVGSINVSGYQSVSVHLCCSCNQDILINLVRGRNTSDSDGKDEMIYVADGLYRCSNCNENIISVAEGRLSRYSYHIKCKCGAEYKKEFDNRLRETASRLRARTKNRL